jgi:hypothetical protein
MGLVHGIEMLSHKKIPGKQINKNQNLFFTMIVTGGERYMENAFYYFITIFMPEFFKILSYNFIKFMPIGILMEPKRLSDVPDFFTGC